MTGREEGGKNIKAKKTPQTLMLYETQALANIILMDYMAFQSFSFTIRSKLKKNIALRSEKSGRLHFFFSNDKVF